MSDIINITLHYITFHYLAELGAAGDGQLQLAVRGGAAGDGGLALGAPPARQPQEDLQRGRGQGEAGRVVPLCEGTSWHCEGGIGTRLT